MVAVGRTLRASPIVDYDYATDVLYVSLGRAVPDEGEDGERGIVFRFALKNGAPSGVTVVGLLRNNWGNRLSDLAEIIAKHLQIDSIGVLMVLERKLKDI